MLPGIFLQLIYDRHERTYLYPTLLGELLGCGGRLVLRSLAICGAKTVTLGVRMGDGTDVREGAGEIDQLMVVNDN